MSGGGDPMATLTRTDAPGTKAATRAGAGDRAEAAVRLAAGFEAFAAGRDEPEAVRRLRRRAIDRFAELGIPTTRQEAWRFTDLRPLAEARFERATGAAAVDAAALAPHVFDAAARLVFVDGFLVPGLSALDGLPGGAFAGSLAAALDGEPHPAAEQLGRLAGVDEQPFAALATAFFADGALIALPRGVAVEGPIHLLFLSTAAGDGLVAPSSFPRTLVVAGEASQATVVETYAGLAEGAYLSASVTEVVAGPGAVVDHYKVQRESRGAFHLATLAVHQERSSNFFSHSVSSGGAITRNDVGAVLAGEGGSCTLNGLYLADGDQLVDNHMRVDHVAAHCFSYELYKGVLDGRARSVFNGLIHVHPGAQKTDAKQSNRNLLLSQGSIANSNPQHEIFADDVRCTHGSTVGQLDDEAVFYLRSRGIGEQAAKSLLTYAFASDIVGRVKVDPVRRDLEEFLFARLPRGEVVRQAV